MSVSAPHFLLYSDSQAGRRSGPAGDWRFVLQAADGSAKVEVADSEPGTQGERLELLAVVRGLEALEQPSRVTLVTPSRYVSRGLAYGLQDWRDNGWQWERHGQMVPVKNGDLWQRIDRALEFHRVECRQWRFDTAENNSAPAEQAREPVIRSKSRPATPAAATSRRRGTARHWLLSLQRTFREWIEAFRLRVRQLGTSFLPTPWLD